MSCFVRPAGPREKKGIHNRQGSKRLARYYTMFAAAAEKKNTTTTKRCQLTVPYPIMTWNPHEGPHEYHTLSK